MPNITLTLPKKGEARAIAEPLITAALEAIASFINKGTIERLVNKEIKNEDVAANAITGENVQNESITAEKLGTGTMKLNQVTNYVEETASKAAWEAGKKLDTLRPRFVIWTATTSEAKLEVNGVTISTTRLMVSFILPPNATLKANQEGTVRSIKL